MVSWLKRLTDRMVLWPSTDPIDPGELKRQLIPVDGGHLEAWTTEHRTGSSHRKLLLVKFPGNAGRAERSTANPAHLLADVASDVWTINPFGYGGSLGPATLQRYPEMVDAVYDFVRPRYPDHKLLVYGRSLGAISALSFAAKYPVDGMYLWNPVPIHQMIATRLAYAIPTLGLSRVFAMQIPRELDAIRNAKSCIAPCLMVTSGKDKMVPPKFQAKIVHHYAGPKCIFDMPDAGHEDSIPDELEQAYRRDIGWLCDQIF